MTSNDSVSSKAARARLKAKGGASFGASLQPDVAAIVTNAMGRWKCSRNAALNELIRMAGDQHGFTPPEPDDCGQFGDKSEPKASVATQSGDGHEK